MDSFIISCCSTSDMPLSFFEETGIKFLPFHFIIDGEEYPDDCGTTMSYDEFYKRINNGSLPTTSQVNIGEYIRFFEPILQSGKDILHICFSSGLSGSYNSACNAKEELAEKYPERTIKIVDSLCASSGYGLLMDKVNELWKAGATLDELYLFVEENKCNVRHWVYASDLFHLKRGGRISSASATFGSLLNTCPVIDVNYKGELIVREKARGKKKAMQSLLNHMKEQCKDQLEYSEKCFLSNANCPEDAKMLASMIEETFPKMNGKVKICNIGTVIGAHTGPGTIALFFWGDKRVN